MLKQPVAVMCFSGGNGGMERSAVRLADILSQIADVTLCCKRGSFIEDLYKQNKGNAFACETVNFSSRKFSPSMLLRVRSMLKENKFGNVIFFGASELKTLYFAFIGHQLNLVVWHGTTKSKAKRDFIHRLVYSGVNYHVALSNHLLNNVKTIVPENDQVEYRVIYPSFKIEVNPAAGNTVKKDTLRLVHIGRIAAGKGQLDAVNACRLLYESGVDFELDLLGPSSDEKYSRELHELIASVPYADRIRLPGFVEDPQIYLEQADIFLFPSFGEGMPGAFIEALHFGIPCLAYANTVFPEYLTMGFHVVLAADRDQQDLAVKLLAMIENLQQERQMSYANAELARQYFDVQHELASWREILK